jgi:hypothetical protein
LVTEVPEDFHQLLHALRNDSRAASAEAERRR